MVCDKEPDKLDKLILEMEVARDEETTGRLILGEVMVCDKEPERLDKLMLEMEVARGEETPDRLILGDVVVSDNEADMLERLMLEIALARDDEADMLGKLVLEMVTVKDGETDMLDKPVLEIGLLNDEEAVMLGKLVLGAVVMPEDESDMLDKLMLEIVMVKDEDGEVVISDEGTDTLDVRILVMVVVTPEEVSVVTIVTSELNELGGVATDATGLVVIEPVDILIAGKPELRVFPGIELEVGRVVERLNNDETIVGDLVTDEPRERLEELVGAETLGMESEGVETLVINELIETVEPPVDAGRLDIEIDDIEINELIGTIEEPVDAERLDIEIDDIEINELIGTTEEPVDAERLDIEIDDVETNELSGTIEEPVDAVTLDTGSDDVEALRSDEPRETVDRLVDVTKLEAEGNCVNPLVTNELVEAVGELLDGVRLSKEKGGVETLVTDESTVRDEEPNGDVPDEPIETVGEPRTLDMGSDCVGALVEILKVPLEEDADEVPRMSVEALGLVKPVEIVGEEVSNTAVVDKEDVNNPVNADVELVALPERVKVGELKKLKMDDDCPLVKESGVDASEIEAEGVEDRLIDGIEELPICDKLLDCVGKLVV